MSFVAIMISCDKQYEITTPDLDVSTLASRYNVGDTVLFNISGSNADFLSFYAGESTSDYNYLSKEKRLSASTALSFWSAKYAGNNADCAKLMYSTNFNGVYEIASIKAATWVDISDRFFIPPIGEATYFYSEEADISDLFVSPEKPIHFAWLLTIAENSRRTLFKVQRFEIRAIVRKDESCSRIKYDFVDSAFKMVLATEWEGALPNVSTTDIMLAGTSVNTTYREAWGVSGPIYLATEVNLGTAKAIGIKCLGDRMPSTYSYVYKQPGNYTATFVAANSSIYGRKEVVKSVNIVVE